MGQKEAKCELCICNFGEIRISDIHRLQNFV